MENNTSQQEKFYDSLADFDRQRWNNLMIGYPVEFIGLNEILFKTVEDIKFWNRKEKNIILQRCLIAGAICIALTIIAIKLDSTLFLLAAMISASAIFLFHFTNNKREIFLNRKKLAIANLGGLQERLTSTTKSHEEQASIVINVKKGEVEFVRSYLSLKREYQNAVPIMNDAQVTVLWNLIKDDFQKEHELYADCYAAERDVLKQEIAFLEKIIKS